MRWTDEQAPSCEACRVIYAGKEPPEQPPCDKCRPALLPENEDIINVYLLARWQFVTFGEGQPVDISIPAVKIAMDLLGVRNQLDCLGKVRKLFHEFKPRMERKA